MIDILKSYLKRLTNLSGNNRSLLLLRLPKEQCIDIHAFNFLNNEPSFNIIDQLITGKNKILLCPEVDTHDDDSNRMSRQLKKLFRVEKFIYEEQGTKDLFIGWPFIRGKFLDDTPVRAPLLFFPVEVTLLNGSWYLQQRKDINITFNKSFLLAYAYYNNVKIGDELLEKVIEEFDNNSTVFRTSLYQELKESPIEINFNQENFKDILIQFQHYKKKDYEQELKTGELKLFPEAVLGIFPQSGSHLVPDYNYMLEHSPFEDMNALFEQRSSNDDDQTDTSAMLQKLNFLQMVKEEKTFTPFKMDAYQENALKAVKTGKSIVVQGPPGTGKSQLICNLISDNIATGKTVLLVCQKRAALDVVYARMKEIGMENFISLVHDFKNDRKTIYEKIAYQIENLSNYKLKNSNLDSITLERDFLRNSRKIDQTTEEFEEFKNILFDETECGLSVKELYLTSDIDKPVVNLKQEYRNLHFDRINEFVSKLKQFNSYALTFNKFDHPFYNRNSFKDRSVHDLTTMKEYLDDIPKYQQEVSDKVEKIIGAPIALVDAEAIHSKIEHVKEMLGILKNPQVFKYFKHMQPYSDKETDLLWLANTERVLMECYKGIGPELNLEADELGKFQEVLERTMQSRKGLIKLIRWELFSKDKYLIKRVLVDNDLKSNREGFKLLVEKIDNRLNLEHNITKIKKQSWLNYLPKSYEKGKYQNWFYTQRQAMKAKLIFNSLRNIKDYFNVQSLKYSDLETKFEELYMIIKNIPSKEILWQKYYTEHQVRHLLEDSSYVSKIKKALNKDFDALCEYDKLLDTFSLDESKVIEKLYNEIEQPTDDQLIELFQNSIRLAWIEHIEVKYPEVRMVSSLKFKQMEEELQNAVKEKLIASKDILLLKARERAYEKVEYNRLNNRVTYRDLEHQTTKKRRVWPLRKLIAEHYEELFDLVPCWLASPESVSAIFPMRQMFDLVIFDEASQCFTEKGIPSIFRGRQIAVAGDNQQLRPNDLYKIRYEDESEEGIELELDSLLELAEKFLLQIKLQGHYRSKSMELIDFSNKHFYKGGLKLLPDKKDANSEVPGISFEKVDGVWENNTNLEEAQKVVTLLMNHLRDVPDKAVGVVTFNVKQQMLITDLFEEELVKEKTPVPAHYFIKNIENIQGDEKDVIIFSTAYAPDTSGRMIMQFGSLNAENGENRLNVAITRAREKVIIVSSIFPQQLKVDDAKNAGPKLLREYLNYALDVSNGNYQPTLFDNNSHANAWYLSQKIQDWAKDNLKQLTINNELPFSDLTIKEKNKYIGLVLTDDNLYYQSTSMKDVHVYTPFTLSAKHWKFKGIFSREYWANKEEVLESIQRFANNIED